MNVVRVKIVLCFLGFFGAFIFQAVFAGQEKVLLSRNDIIEILSKKTEPFKNKKAALLLARRMNTPFNEREEKILNSFIFESITGNLSEKERKDIFDISKYLCLNLEDAELKAYETVIKNANISALTVNMVFYILYANYYYTPEHKKQLLDYLFSLKGNNLQNPQYIVSMVYHLYNERPYSISNSGSSNDSSLSKCCWAKRSRKLSEFSSDKLFYPLVLYKYIKILTSNSAILEYAVRNNATLFHQLWEEAPGELYYFRLDSYGKGLEISDSMVSFLKKNKNKPEIRSVVLQALSENLFTMGYLKNHFTFFYKLSQSANIGDAVKEYLAKILLFLANNDKRNIKKIINDNASIESFPFKDLLKDKFNNAAWNYLRNYALCFDDFQLPKSYKSILQDIIDGDIRENRLSIMSIALIQKNPIYANDIKHFILKILNDIDNYEAVKSLFFDCGISYHWINNNEIRKKCLNLLSKDYNFDNSILLIHLFWNINSDKKHIALLLLDYYDKLRKKNL